MLSKYFTESNEVIMAVGVALILGWGAGLLCKKLKVPMVVGFILVGILFGESVFGIFNENNFDGLVVFTYIALACIGFDIGGELAFRKLSSLAKSIIWIAVLESLAASTLVFLIIWLYTGKLQMALIFGALASATAPAATVDVIREYQATGILTTTLFAVVGIDDAVAILIYAFSIFFAKVALSGEPLGFYGMIFDPGWEIIGSALVGFLVGVLFLYLTRKYTAKRGLLVLVWGAIAMVTGMSLCLNLSLILANMSLGITIVNVTKWRREDLFEIVRGTTQPLFVIFFIIVGSKLNMTTVFSLGWLGVLYILFRSLGKQVGAYLGAVISKASLNVRKYLGLCLLSQAGVAIGLSIQTMIEFGGGRYGEAGVELGITAINVIAATTLFFQLIGPLFTRYAIVKSGEARV